MNGNHSLPGGMVRSLTADDFASAEVTREQDTAGARDTDPHWQAYMTAVETAAFLGTFDPLALIPNATEDLLERLLGDCSVTTDGYRSRWMLKSSVRIDMLRRLSEPRARLQQKAMEAAGLVDRSRMELDHVGHALINLLGNVAPVNFALLSRDALAAYRAVLDWLKEVPGISHLNAAALLAEIQMTELLEPFQFLTGFDPQTGKDIFVGRTDELRKLRSFVDVLESASLYESIQRSTHRRFKDESRTYFISGIGGVGKSTLVAKFILQHIRSPEAGAMRFSYLDFDRSTLTAAQPVTLLLEIIRQIGWQWHEGQTELENMRRRIREEIERTGRDRPRTGKGGPPRATQGGTAMAWHAAVPALPAEALSPTSLYRYLSDLNWSLEKLPPGPLLIVLDTFEEAQALGDEAVRRVETFLSTAKQSVRNLRVVIVGRDEAEGFFLDAERLLLKEYEDQGSRRRFLEMRGVAPDLSPKVAREVGGRPLALLLAARLVREYGVDAVTMSLSERFKGLFQERLIDGILFGRILNHIKDEDVRKLAHPGLVLRRVNADIIEKVLVPVLGLTTFDSDRINRVMAMLERQKDLVRVEPDGSVTHRPDVREQMLVLMTAKEPRLVRNLHEAAVRYYAYARLRAPHEVEREAYQVEEIYHRLAAGIELEHIPDIWIPKARILLSSAINEIQDPGGRATLKVMLGRTPTGDEIRALPSRMYGEFATRAIEAAISSDSPERGLAVFREYGDYIQLELRDRLAAILFDRAGLWHEASNYYNAMLSLSARQDPCGSLEAATFFERFPYAEKEWEMLRERLAKHYAALHDDEPDDAIPILLAQLRIEIRLKEGLPAFERAMQELSRCQSRSRPPTLSMESLQWIFTLWPRLTDAELALAESIRISDSVMDQLRFLVRLLQGPRLPTTPMTQAVAICEALYGYRGSYLPVEIFRSSRSSPEAVEILLRHLMRAVTPQWYVPLASTLRDIRRAPIVAEDLFGEMTLTIPFRLPNRFNSTKSLADMFGQLDQFGLLHVVLEHLHSRGYVPRRSNFALLVEAYSSWRRDLLWRTDELFAPFLRA